jgi:pyrophosphatase PpaX
MFPVRERRPPGDYLLTMARFTTLLFDLDGTLIDSIGLIIASYQHTANAHGLPPRSDEEWLHGIGTPLRVVFRELVEHPEQMEQLVATYRAYNLAHHDAQVVPYVGAPELIRRVKSEGYKTGLVTSKNRPGAVRGLVLAGIADHFEVLVCADDVVNPKPHPEPVLLALDRLGSRPEEALFVGDSVHDMRCGRDAGVLTAAVLWGPFGREHLAATGPDFWLESPGDLLKILGINGNTPTA